MASHLDVFGRVYTLNYEGERNPCISEAIILSKSCARETNTWKMLMWIPVVAQIVGTMLLIDAIDDYKKDTYKRDLQNIAMISRCVIAITATPLLIPIDVVGTLVKLCLNWINRIQKEKYQPS